MATLRITEYHSIGRSGAQAPAEPAVAHQVVTFTTSTQSTAFTDSTRLVRLYSATSCYVLFGDNPTATTSHEFLIGGVPEIRAVTPGQKVAAYDGSS